MIEREKEIFLYLAKAEGLTTRQELADFLHVSRSTVRNEIKALETRLRSHQTKARLIHIRGSGLKLENGGDPMETFDRIFEETAPQSNRAYRILYYLLNSRREFVRLNDLAEEFYLSRSALQNELDQIERILTDKHLRFDYSKGKGVKISGDEQPLRRLLSEIIMKENQRCDPYGFKSSYRSIKENIEQLLRIDPDGIRFCLKNTLNEIGITLSESSLNTLLIHITIGIARIRNGNTLKMNAAYPIRYQAIYQSVERLCQAIGQKYNVLFPPDEILLIYQYLISSNDVIDNRICEDPQTLKKCRKLAREMIRVVEETRRITIREKSVEDNLMMHLIPLSHRLENKIVLKNPMLEQIKSEYPDAFGIAWMCNSLFRRCFNADLKDDELAYLAIHIETMIEQEEQFIRAVIVCSQGIGVSQFIASRIQNTFKKIRVVDTIQEEQIAALERKNVDVLITTYPIKTDLDTILVSPLISRKDCAKIQAVADEYLQKKLSLFTLVRLDTILHSVAKTQDEVIRQVFRRLQEKGDVTDAYYDSLLARERKCSTAIGMKTAIPHADPSTVLRSVICIVTLIEPILWGQESVDVILFLAIRDDEIKKVNLKLRELYRKLYQEAIHSALLNAENEQEIIEKIG